MLIASIVPTGNLDLIFDDQYHMALAHLVGEDKQYTAFYANQARMGRWVLMDNGVVETGVPLPFDELLARAGLIGATEVVLPDKIGDRRETLRLGLGALSLWAGVKGKRTPRLMSVPQGETAREWELCASEMIAWPVGALGISRFAPKWEALRGWRSRVACLASRTGGRLRKSKRAIHLLGCGDEIGEAAEIEVNWPGRIRGTDSGVATMATAQGLLLSVGGERVHGKLDVATRLDPVALAANLAVWRRSCLSSIGSGVEERHA
jgi:hypothetical protein